MAHILLVDDEKDNLDAITRLLRKDYQITSTTSSFEALKYLQKQKFEAIVSDQRMPEMTGVELLEKARAICPETTRVLLTGYTDIESLVGAINRGQIYRYITKPWDPEDLKLTVRQAVETHNLKKEIEEKNQKLLEMNQQLEGLSRAKSRFLSLISHELNTPLTIQTSFLSLLEEEKPLLKPEVQKAISRLKNATENLLQLVSQVLEFIRFESEEQNEEVAAEEILRDLGFSVDGQYSLFSNRVALQTAFQRFSEEIGSKPKVSLSPTQWKIEWNGKPLGPTAFDLLDFKSQPLHHQRSLGLKLPLFRSILERNGGTLHYQHQGNSNLLMILFRK